MINHQGDFIGAMTLLQLCDVELDRSQRDLSDASSYSCSNVKIPTE
jgi:hypothetical protein